jgi:hypothetical protein
MKTELDRIPSTITLSLGLKNRIRELKGSMTYEEFLSQLVRTRNELAHTNKNYVEIQKIRRKESVSSFGDYKIVYSFNEYNHSDNFIFDIHVQLVRKKGEKILFEELVMILDAAPNDMLNDHQQFFYACYFNILTIIIQQSIEPTFKHKGRFEDYYTWKKEFEKLGLSKKSFEQDVMEKLTDYSNGVIFSW